MERSKMTPKFICLSMPARSAAGGAFTGDPKARWTTIRKGALIGGNLIIDRGSAAKVFALRIARQQYGRHAQADAWESDAIASISNHTIYQCTMNDGSHFAEARFVIIERAD
jgi:hypothetical protein